MTENLRFTSETVLDVTGSTEVKDVHLKDLSFVLDIEHDDGEIQRCDIDIRELIRVATLYGSMEGHRYQWRRAPSELDRLSR